jgi:hypothetical protein
MDVDKYHEQDYTVGADLNGATDLSGKFDGLLKKLQRHCMRLGKTAVTTT